MFIQSIIVDSEQVFSAIDTGDSEYLNNLKHHCPAKSSIRLRVGAQVVIVKNIDVQRNLANGTRAVVVGFTK